MAAGDMEYGGTFAGVAISGLEALSVIVLSKVAGEGSDVRQGWVGAQGAHCQDKPVSVNEFGPAKARDPGERAAPFLDRV